MPCRYHDRILKNQNADKLMFYTTALVELNHEHRHNSIQTKVFLFVHSYALVTCYDSSLVSLAVAVFASSNRINPSSRLYSYCGKMEDAPKTTNSDLVDRAGMTTFV